jgi:hypothetical protein
LYSYDYTSYRHNNFAFRAPELDSIINQAIRDDENDNNHSQHHHQQQQQQYSEILHDPAIDVWILGI